MSDGEKFGMGGPGSPPRTPPGFTSRTPARKSFTELNTSEEEVPQRVNPGVETARVTQGQEAEDYIEKVNLGEETARVTNEQGKESYSGRVNSGEKTARVTH